LETRKYSPRGHCRATAGAAAKQIRAQTTILKESARLPLDAVKNWFISRHHPVVTSLIAKSS
jgi:hypothetical protein